MAAGGILHIFSHVEGASIHLYLTQLLAVRKSLTMGQLERYHCGVYHHLWSRYVFQGDGGEREMLMCGFVSYCASWLVLNTGNKMVKVLIR